ncbi:hypothetical protein GPECTOR_30g200 [Gonium pectorale]|uniref:Uncharacterized protein n=1 Tax=Gonium pectorale TaxID=33097 RepID=A0A150GEV6_GONPE|nr:hypothetical protein GPECTOR_30g200 [Gonium pectorale]|eukprot:KXZ48105.1 hypothetical protein GPECTOR_30g200 [Gonium pectorale]
MFSEGPVACLAPFHYANRAMSCDPYVLLLLLSNGTGLLLAGDPLWLALGYGLTA